MVEAVKNYAISKEGLKAYNERIKATEELYKDVADANIDSELTADLVGEYLFSDSAFLEKLCREDMNIFQRLWQEVKDLAKLATAGSKEKRQLAKAEAAFVKAYRATENATEAKAQTGGGVEYSIERTQNMSWDEQVKGALYDGGNIRRNDTLIVADPADTAVANVIENIPLAIPKSVLTKASDGRDVSHSIKRGKLAKLDAGIKNAELTIVNPERNAVVFVTNIKQGGLPVVAAFEMNTTFDGDNVHKATSIHLQVDTQAMLQNLPESATVYVQKNELDPVGATNNLRGLAAKIEFVDSVQQNGQNVNSEFSLSKEGETVGGWMARMCSWTWRPMRPIGSIPESESSAEQEWQ